MFVITAKGVNDLFVQVARALRNFGIESSPRDLKTVELQNVWLTLDDPRDCVVTLPERGISHEYLGGEMSWYESGSLDVRDIAKHSKFWEGLANADGTVNSNYGYFAFKQDCPNGKSQFDWCVDKIRGDPDTRQAVINYNQVMHKYDGNKDFVCTISQSFRQHDGVIDTVVVMRSNDLIYGLTYDIVWFARILEQVCKATGYAVGKYHHLALSLHVYERHFKMLAAIASAPISTEIVHYSSETSYLHEFNQRIHLVKDIANLVHRQVFPPVKVCERCVGWELCSRREICVSRVSISCPDDDFGWEFQTLHDDLDYYFLLYLVPRSSACVYLDRAGTYYIKSLQVPPRMLTIEEVAGIVPLETLQSAVEKTSLEVC